MVKGLFIAGVTVVMLLPCWASAQQFPTVGVATASAAADFEAPPEGRFIFGKPESVPPFPIVLNHAVQRYVDAFLSSPAGLKQSLRRSRPYWSQMATVLRHWQLPDDLVYLAFAESGFSPQGAGPWQLTKATAREFGLHINHYVDERRDPIKSTRAAAEYLATLHDETHDWKLTLVGWNAGGATADALMKLKGAGYNKLLSHLTEPTRALLNRFMAVAIIERNAKSYGLEPVKFSTPPSYHMIAVKGGTSLTKVASKEGITVKHLHDLNPALLTDKVPPYAKTYPIRVPARTAAATSDNSKPF